MVDDESASDKETMQMVDIFDLKTFVIFIFAFLI